VVQTAKKVSDLIRPDAPAPAARAALGLGNVDNTADADKPISKATQAALDLKAPLGSPTSPGMITGVAVGASGGALGAGYRAGAWAAAYAGTITAAIPAQAIATASPLHIPVACEIGRNACEVTAGGSPNSMVRLGIYADNGFGYPGARVLDAGTVNGTTTGIKELAISQALAAGRYWLVGCNQGAPKTGATVRVNAGQATPVLASSSAILASNAAVYAMASTTGALPSTWTATLQSAASGHRVAIQFV
jgi:hypothetical protein